MYNKRHKSNNSEVKQIALVFSTTRVAIDRVAILSFLFYLLLSMSLSDE